MLIELFFKTFYEFGCWFSGEYMADLSSFLFSKAASPAGCISPGSVSFFTFLILIALHILPDFRWVKRIW